ncbi:MAG: hypothetical protein RLZZ241_149 [Bacteroidota bacterium]|jgi:lysophospholipase L1-like esterase
MTHWNKIGLLLLILNLSCTKKPDPNERTAPPTFTIYTIGDSTMAEKLNPEQNPERGWVQMLPLFLNQPLSIENHAVNGRSTKSFIAEGRWDSIYKRLQQDDLVFIQFGHNDQKEQDPKRYTNPHTTYRQNLIKFVTEAREKGAVPVLFSSIARRNFNEAGTLIDTHGAYPQEVRMVAEQFYVPFIDLQLLTEQLEVSYGEEGSKVLHLHYKPGELAYYPEGKEDNTHLSVKGAKEVAKLAASSLKLKVTSLAPFIQIKN